MPYYGIKRIVTLCDLYKYATTVIEYPLPDQYLIVLKDGVDKQKFLNALPILLEVVVYSSHEEWSDSIEHRVQEFKNKSMIHQPHLFLNERKIK